jgi:hypothetical protein
MERVELELVGRHVLKSYMQMNFLGIYIYTVIPWLTSDPANEDFFVVFGLG